MPRIKKATKKFIKKKRTFRKKRSHMVKLGNGGVKVVFIPRHINDPIPEQFETTIYGQFRFGMDVGLTTSLVTGSNSFDIQLCQCFSPTTANTQTGFVSMAAMSPACAFLGDFNGLMKGYSIFAGLYENYAVLKSTISLSLDNYTDSRDEFRAYIRPVIQAINFETGSATNIVSDKLIAAQPYVKTRLWSPFTTNMGSSLTNTVNLPQMLGYSSTKEYINDKDNNSFNTVNTNQRPGNDGFWQLAFVSNTNAAGIAHSNWTITLKRRVLFYGVFNNLA